MCECVYVCTWCAWVQVCAHHRSLSTYCLGLLILCVFQTNWPINFPMIVLSHLPSYCTRTGITGAHHHTCVLFMGILIHIQITRVGNCFHPLSCELEFNWVHKGLPSLQRVSRSLLPTEHRVMGRDVFLSFSLVSFHLQMTCDDSACTVNWKFSNKIVCWKKWEKSNNTF